ncbi:MAG: hypothetical protein H5T96_07600 [Tissierellales bacterium]|nr:hypothetical protein [Tissierellales bacterium]
MKLIDKLKDFLYDSIDYIIMLSIVVIVVLVIGWRLDILFASNDISDNQYVEINEPIKNIENPTSDNINDSNNGEIPENTDTQEIVEININIPDGSLPYDIGKILQENGLVESSNDFVKKAVELGLDTKLKSGKFSLNTSQSIEEIVYIISKQTSGR